jgi:hypothetical protein
MTPSLFQSLQNRLGLQGIGSGEVSSLLRDLAKILESQPEIDPAAATSKLNQLGWNGVSLDYQSLQLAIACIEAESSKPLEKVKVSSTAD